MSEHPALETSVWKTIRILLANHIPFTIHNQYGESKYITPNYKLSDLCDFYKFCYEMGDVMTLEVK